MKQQKIKRIVSGFLAFVMVALMIPFSTFVATAADVTDIGSDPKQMLGMSYNALSGEELGISGLNVGAQWIDLESQATKVYTFGNSDGTGVLEQKGESTYSQSSVEFMESLGVNVSSSMSASFSMPFMKANIGVKLGKSFNLSTTTTADEHYYNYTYRAITNRYVLGNDYSNYLSAAFLNAIDKLYKDVGKNGLTDQARTVLGNFFEQYGTHMLVAFETGGEINLTAWAYSTTVDKNFKESISTTVEGGLEAGGEAGFKASLTASTEIENAAHTAGYKSATTYYAVGGEAVFVDTELPDGEDRENWIGNTAVSDWVKTLPGKSVFIPSTSEWVPVWEVLPVDGSYEYLRSLMYQYFEEQAQGKNLGALAQYCSFSNRITLNGYTYISATKEINGEMRDGYVYQNVPFAKDDKNYVAPGSSIVIAKELVNTTLYDMSDLSYELNADSADYATVDRNGTIRIKEIDSLTKEIKILLRFKYNGILLKTATFIVKEEDKFGGGYGTEARPYLVSKKEHITAISDEDANKHFLLTNDIDFEGSAFGGIPEFSGVLDGGGHRVYGFYSSFDGTSDSMNVVQNLGFIRKNTGTVRNLIIGKAESEYKPKEDEPKELLQGANKVTGEAAQQFSVSIKNVQNDIEIYKISDNHPARISVGALIGWNEGLVDNCRVENTYVYGQLNDKSKTWDGKKEKNLNSYVYVGMIGTNTGLGIVTRAMAVGNYFDACALNKATDTDNTNASYVGGICGRNGGLVEYSISSDNCLRSEARSDGSAKNAAKAIAVAGGIVGRVSDVAEEDHAATFWKVGESIAYGNLFSVYYTETTNTEGHGYLGTVVGQAIKSRNDNKALDKCRTDDKSNDYTTCTDYDFKKKELALVGSLDGIEANDGYSSCTDLESLVDEVESWEYFTKINESTIAISQPTVLKATGGREAYIVGDYLDPQDIEIGATDQEGKAFKTYKLTTHVITFDDGNEETYNTAGADFAGFTIFKVNGFDSSEERANTTITAEVTVPYSGSKPLTANYDYALYAEAVEELLLLQQPYSTSYYAGDALNTAGLSLALKYNTGEVKLLTEGFTVSGYDADVLGDQLITVSYGDMSVTYTVTVYRVKPVGILVSELPEKTNYALGETFDATGLLVTLLYNNGSTEVLAAEEVACAGFDSDSEGSKDVTVSYTYYDEDLGKNCTVIDAFAVNVGTVSAIEIETLPTKLSYYTSDKKVDTAGLSIKVTYTNGVSKTVTGDKAIKVDGYNLSVTGTQEVVVNYQGFRTAYEIEVLPVTLAGVSVKTLPKTQFYVPDQFTASGLVLTLTYVDGSTRDVYEGYIVTVNGYDVGEEPKFLVTGTKTVTVAFEEDGVRKFTEYTIRVAERVMQSIQIVHAPLKQQYKVNESIDTMGMLVYGVFNNGDVMEIKDYVVRTPDLSTVGEKTVKVLYMGTYETEFIVTVVAPERIYIAQMPTKSTYVIGEDFDPTGLVVKAVYWDYSEVILDQGDYSLSDTALSSLGSEKVYVKFGTLQAYFFVQIEEFEVPDDAPKIVIDNANATTGKTVVVNISLKNNPGIASMKLNVAFDQSVLTLTDITYNSEMGGQFQLPQDMDAPVILNWYNGWNNYSEDGVFATLTFTVAEDATHDSYTDIKVTYDPEDVYNILEQNVTFYAEGGDLHVIEYVPGDINGDGEVNNKDVTRMSQYLSGWDVEVCEKALDVNGDGNVNNKDMTRLFQYLSNWDVEIH